MRVSRNNDDDNENETALTKDVFLKGVPAKMWQWQFS